VRTGAFVVAGGAGEAMCVQAGGDDGRGWVEVDVPPEGR
jgi:hypothetical protein